MEWLLLLLLKPFLFLMFFLLIVYPIKLAILKFVPEGRLRRLLLRRVN